ncbi:MAG: hypothetical protein M3O28_06250 [Actinomycetota bacterium]|nr:hypothetical protein [Actinomycetota bacterium]
MRIQHTAAAIAVIAGLASLGACSSNSSGSGSTSASVTTTATTTGAPTTAASGATSAATSGLAGITGTTFCTKLAATSAKLAGLGSAISNPASASALIDAEVAEFNALRAGAPADVAGAITDLVSVLQAIKGYLANPTATPPAALQSLQTKLPADSQILGTYVAKNCAHG